MFLFLREVDLGGCIHWDGVLCEGSYVASRQYLDISTKM